VTLQLELAGARVSFSTRYGGVSEGPYESLNLGVLTDDDPTNVEENRRRYAESSDIPAENVAMGWQVHGAEILDWDAPPADGGYARAGAELPRVDGHATNEPNLGLLVLVADCVPVALATHERIAMLHCGRRPLAGGIVERALETFDEPPAAAIGPGIGPCCYEVGDEVLAEFAGMDGVASGRMLDLKAIVRRKLEAGGVRDIVDLHLCTSCMPELFFSHRRDKGVTGRQGGLIWRRP
jgi:hypothetical protein